MQGDGFENQIGEIVAGAVDCFKALARENLISLAGTAFLIFSGAIIIIISVSFLMFGAANGLSVALALPLWLGALITGSVFLAVTILSLAFISFRAKRRSSKKKAQLSRKVSELGDFMWWAKEYPFYSTGAAAAAGFALSGVITSNDSQKDDVAEPQPVGLQTSIITMLLALAEDVLKEAVVPFVKDHLKPEDHNAREVN